jgi:voltage-gated potassium channel
VRGRLLWARFLALSVTREKTAEEREGGLALSDAPKIDAEHESRRPSLSALLARARTTLYRTAKFVRLRLWFPHLPLAALFVIGGVWLLARDLGSGWPQFLKQVILGRTVVPPRSLPEALIGGGMVLVAAGLMFRSRVAWTMAVLLAIAAAAATAFGHAHPEYILLAYFVFMAIALLSAWNSFDRASLAASTLFAFTSVMMLLMYATFGAYYLGADFKPQIKDLVTALYYAVVTMSTVGYGDITPQTPRAELFSMSVIILGVAVFATSLTAVIAPLVTKSLNHIVSRKGHAMKRTGHFVIIGNTALALNTWRELARRGRPVTRILREAPPAAELETADVVVGDPSKVSVLKEAGADKAEAVLAMTDDDSENAFVILAVKELACKARTVAAVNDSHHMGRIRLVQPDLVIAPQVLGGELMAMMLSGEKVTSEFVMQRVFASGDQS